jgi:hypothetical protein
MPMRVNFLLTPGDAFVALGGNSDLTGTISTKKIQETLLNNFELSDDLEVIIFIKIRKF